MNRSRTFQDAAALEAATDSRASDVLIVVCASFLLALSAQISVPVPFSAVPLTMQPFALLVLGSALGWKRALATTLTYLAEGAMGLPVFAHGSAGIVEFAGPTAGYLFAFPLTAAIAGLSTSGANRKPLLVRIAVMIAAIAVLYLGGWSWLAGPMGLGAARAFAFGVAPFIAADLCKALIAAFASRRAMEFVERFTR